MRTVMSYSLVWFKRDLRISDHAPLVHAAQRGALLCVYVLEPSLWRQPDAALQHYLFLQESLRDLDQRLRHCGAQLHIAVGELTEVLDRLHIKAPFDTLLSHEETGNSQTFARDRAVARWCRRHAVAWREWPQNGVIRRLASRNGWAKSWHAFMYAARPAAPAQDSLHAVPWPEQCTATLLLEWDQMPDFGLAADAPPQRQRGGRTLARAVLQDFLTDRSVRYRGGISSPLSAPSACSRLSPYLAFGCLSMREVTQATQQRLQQLKETGAASSQQRLGLNAFVGRLHWHCHFIQKLESEPSIEFRNLHRGYDGLREGEWNQAHFDALVAGRTGWPMVDACVEMLRQTGWLNFRMRAMLVSVASYPLWLHWREVGQWLARQFLDYEPGIHWSQMQMQAGTTGINTTRVYNPIKQAQDHDPHGSFVRRWLPALRQVPDEWLRQPWLMPLSVQQQIGLYVGHEIAVPLVELETATKLAKARVHALRAEPKVREGKRAIVAKHGSRAVRKSTRRAKVQKAESSQQQFEF